MVYPITLLLCCGLFYFIFFDELCCGLFDSDFVAPLITGLVWCGVKPASCGMNI